MLRGSDNENGEPNADASPSESLLSVHYKKGPLDAIIGVSAAETEPESVVDSSFVVAVDADVEMEMEMEPAVSAAVPSKKKNASSMKDDLKRLIQSHEELARYYQIKANSRLVLLQGVSGEAPYRCHPDTVSDLHSYFQRLSAASAASDFDYAAFLRTHHLPLLAKLVQDAQVPLPELLADLKAILLPLGSSFAEDPRLALPSTVITESFERVSYGHPKASAFTALSCTLWQVKELALLGETVGRHYLQSFVVRQAAKMILDSHLAELGAAESVSVPVSEALLLPASRPVSEECEVSAMEAMKIDSLRQSSSSTPIAKRTGDTDLGSASAAKKTAASASAAAVALESNLKISSFFAKAKKPAGELKVERVPGEYFQPFFVKPSVAVASSTALRDLGLMRLGTSTETETKTDAIWTSPAAYWASFRQSAIRLPGARSKPHVLCVGLNGKPIRTVLKLLQFDENHRPAYYGTWRRTAPSQSCGPRRPFASVPDVDYEYDSDAEWEDADGDEEGESLSEMSDEEEEEEGEDSDLEGDEMTDADSSEDSWLVPHGYLSEDEGVDEGDEKAPAARSEAAETATSGRRRSERRKFVPKEPVMVGPFFATSLEQPAPSLLQSIAFRAVPGAESLWRTEPFAGYEAVFAGLEERRKGSANGPGEGSVFPDTLLPTLIKIIQENAVAGVTKLYDEFILLHGKTVTRRAFESRLNQITTGKMKGDDGRAKWCLKEEYLETATVSVSVSVAATSADSDCMQVEAAIPEPIGTAMAD